MIETADMPTGLGGLLQRLDRWQGRRSWLAFPFAVLKKFGDDRAGNLAAMIAYYAIFSIFPLLLVLSTVLGFVLDGHPDWQHTVNDSALKSLPLTFDTASPSSGSIPVLVVGSIFALWSGLGIAKSAQTALDTIYLVAHTDRPDFLWSALRALRIIIVGGLGFIFTTAVAGAVTSVTSIGGFDVGARWRFVGIAVAVLLNTLLFLVLLRWLTVEHVGWRDALPGALISAVALQLLQLAASALIAHQFDGASTKYGKDVATVIVLLSWFSLQAQIVLFAAEVNVVRQYRLWPRSLSDPPATKRSLVAER